MYESSSLPKRQIEEIPLEEIPSLCQSLLDGWQTFMAKVEKRRRHLHADDSVDPIITRSIGGRPDPNSPFAQVSKYQTDRLRRTGVDWVNRIAENPVVFDVASEDDAADAGDKDAGNTVARIWNAAWRDNELRTSPPSKLQDLIGWAQAADPYAVLHTCRQEFLWPALEKMTLEERPTGKHADAFKAEPEDIEEDETCETCGGEGTVPNGDAKAACPDCNGGVRVVKRRKYVEKGEHFEQRQLRTWAEGGGCGWVDEIVDWMQFIPIFDRGGGLKGGLLHFEVDISAYTAAQRDGLSIDDLRSAQRAPGDEHSSVPHETPTSGDRKQVVTVFQLWTRSHCYEYVKGLPAERDGDGIRGFDHGYDGVPFWIIPCHDTGHPDPQWRFECALEGQFRVKEFVDRAFTITGAGVEAQANPLTTTAAMSTANGNGPGLLPASAIGPDGNPVDVGTEAGRSEMYTGERKAISFPLPASVPQWLEFIDQKMAEAAPETGRADIEPSSQAWTTRLAQSQANIGPRRAIEYQRVAFEQCVNFKTRWHIRHNVPLVNYPRNADGYRLTKAPLVVEPSELEFLTPIAIINMTGKGEEITNVEHAVSMWERGVGLEEDIYEAQGHDDPQARSLEVRTARIMAGLLDQYIQQEIGARMGSRFVLGPMGEMIGAGGVSANPADVAMANGITPGPSQVARQMAEQAAMAAQQPKQGGGASKSVSPIVQSAAAQTKFPTLPALKPPDAPSLAGRPA